MTPDICSLVHVHNHVWQFYDNCRTLKGGSTNYFDLVDISTWLWSKLNQYMLIVWVFFKGKLPHV